MVRRALAIEDGNLTTPAIVTSRRVNYVDVDLSFEPKPSGDIYKKVDAAAVRQAVKNLLLTTPGEKPFQPDFGAGLNGLLFDLMDADIEIELAEIIRVAVSNFEPRAKVLDIDINARPDSNSISVRVTFQIVTTEEIVTFQTSISRVR